VECSAVGCVATLKKISIFMRSLVRSNNVGTHVDYCSLSLEKVGSVYHLILGRDVPSSLGLRILGQGLLIGQTIIDSALWHHHGFLSLGLGDQYIVLVYSLRFELGHLDRSLIQNLTQVLYCICGFKISVNLGWSGSRWFVEGRQVFHLHRGETGACCI
jgi:hypothetical protein